MGKPFENIARDRALTGASESPAPRASGFVSHGTDEHVANAIRAANQELEQQCKGQLDLPLSVAVEQRNRAFRDLSQERANFNALRIAELTSLQVQIEEKDSTLASLRKQLSDAERELSNLRDDPKTVIGVGPASHRPTPSAHDSGEHQSLQSALEAAWQEVQDTRERLSSLQDERDAAVRELDEVRVEVYAKLELAQDEVIDLQNQLDDTRRTFEESKDQWEAEAFRLRSEVDEVRQALHSQIEANVHLRRAIASNPPPPAQSASEPPPSMQPELPRASAGPATSKHAELTQAPALTPQETERIMARAEAGATLPFFPPVQPAEPSVESIGAATSYDMGATQPVPLTQVAHMNLGHSGRDGSASVAAAAAGTEALAAAANLDAEIEELNRRSRGFGLGRLFRK